MADWVSMLGGLAGFLASKALDHYAARDETQQTGEPTGPPEAVVETPYQKALDRTEELNFHVNKLTLACLALWSLMKDSGQFTENTLLERIRQIDLMDGKLDGKIGRKVKRCAKCGRVMSRRHGRCLYCGAKDLNQTAFDVV